MSEYVWDGGGNVGVGGVVLVSGGQDSSGVDQ